VTDDNCPFKRFDSRRAEKRMMSRNEKLYKHLDDLEREFAKHLRAEFEEIAGGGYSDFFGRKWYRHRSHHASQPGRTSADSHTRFLEKLEYDIIALREKLGEPLDLGPTALSTEYPNREKSLPDEFHGGQAHLAREMPVFPR
jgi:hypothetical protein